VLKRLQPALVVVMETEIWPNLYREVKRSGAGLVIVNGRISDRAYPRYLPWAWLFGAVLSHPDLILAQTAEDRRRYLGLHAPFARVEIGGNLKYDFDPGQGEAPREVSELIDTLRPGRIAIAASTMPPRDAGDVDEDDIVIATFNELASRYPDLMLILVPRRPERFGVVAEKLDRAGIPYLRRSALPVPNVPRLPCVLLLDSMGELSRLFAIADVVFMGGTFPRRGGHNILEPAFFGKAVVAGPHMENFTAIANEFTEAGALVRVSEPRELPAAMARLLSNGIERDNVGQRARELAMGKRGVTDRIASRLTELYFPLLPTCRAIVLQPLAALWETGVNIRRRRALAKRRRLPRPVISVGGITMGGTGKTPFVDWLTTELHSRGVQPAILTRGYRRKSDEPCVVITAGSQAPAELTGDEPQVYLRRGIAHLAVGADRYDCGGRLLDTLEADLFVMDDGFQHWRLYRDLDIVLIDALDPFGGGSVFPCGRLRESLRALERASAFVITRVQPGITTAPIERVLRQCNPLAPVMRSRVVPRGWMDLRTGATLVELPTTTVAAFCGLANPQSFWRTLGSMGLETRFRWAFADHHHYRIRELRRFGHRARHSGAHAVVITQKDVPNLCPDAIDLMAPLGLYALDIGLELEDPGPLFGLLTPFLGARVG
jgi:tetraacyldisaccharide 4'-kinase